MTGEHSTLYDAAVIGGGPMGSLAAGRMARDGLRVVVFEKDAEPGLSTVCAGGMSADVAPFIELPDEIIERRLSCLRLIVGAQVREWRFPDPAYLTIDRGRFDRHLARRAAEQGAEFRLGARVTHADPRTGIVRARISGGEHEVRARVILFADGPHSLARRTAGFETRPAGELRYCALQADLESVANDFPALEFTADAARNPFGYSWIFPKKDYLSVGLGRLTCVPGPSLVRLLDEFIRSRKDLKGLRVLRRRGAIIPAGPAPTLTAGCGLLIGDAAGMVNPLTGGGYVCGFRSADIAATACAKALHGSTGPDGILEYGRALRRTRQYAAIGLAGAALRFALAVYRNTGRSLYPQLLGGYFRAAHAAMRFGARSF